MKVPFWRTILFKSIIVVNDQFNCFCDKLAKSKSRYVKLFFVKPTKISNSKQFGVKHLKFGNNRWVLLQVTNWRFKRIINYFAFTLKINMPPFLEGYLVYHGVVSFLGTVFLCPIQKSGQNHLALWMAFPPMITMFVL